MIVLPPLSSGNATPCKGQSRVIVFEVPFDRKWPFRWDLWQKNLSLNAPLQVVLVRCTWSLGAYGQVMTPDSILSCYWCLVTGWMSSSWCETALQHTGFTGFEWQMSATSNDLNCSLSNDSLKSHPAHTLKILSCHCLHESRGRGPQCEESSSPQGMWSIP